MSVSNPVWTRQFDLYIGNALSKKEMKYIENAIEFSARYNNLKQIDDTQPIFRWSRDNADFTNVLSVVLERKYGCSSRKLRFWQTVTDYLENKFTALPEEVIWETEEELGLFVLTDSLPTLKPLDDPSVIELSNSDNDYTMKIEYYTKLESGLSDSKDYILDCCNTLMNKKQRGETVTITLTSK